MGAFRARFHKFSASRQDGENQALQARVWSFYRGLLLTSRFATAHKPVILTGSREDDEIGVRQTQDLETPAECVFRGYPEVSQAELRQAADLAVQLGEIPTVEELIDRIMADAPHPGAADGIAWCRKQSNFEGRVNSSRFLDARRRAPLKQDQYSSIVISEADAYGRKGRWAYSLHIGNLAQPLSEPRWRLAKSAQIGSRTD
jgi:hypothetical protein